MTMEHGEDCCVKVAVHVRPLIGDEKLQGCKDCVAVVPGKPQVCIISFCPFWTANSCFVAGDG
jgi:kinesin family protein 4/21/27